MKAAILSRSDRVSLETVARIAPAPARLRDGETEVAGSFLRRWDAEPELKFAELIVGRVQLASPLKWNHAGRDSLATALLGHYALSTPHCQFGNNATTILGAEIVQPDFCLCLGPERHGQCVQNADGYLAGAPELVYETAVTSEAVDLGRKREIYERAGVREYVVQTGGAGNRPARLVCMRLRNGRFELEPSGGIFKSEIFPGLWLDTDAIPANDYPRAMRTLNQGIDSPEYAQFAKI